MKQEKKRIYLRAALALIALLAVLLALDNLSFVPSMLLTVLRKGAIYALVAVSMNLLNGFTGLFSLGQAGFMLLGAYAYAILTIPAASQKSIYQRYSNGGLGFSIPELLSKPLGGLGLLLGVIFCLLLAGFVAALFAFLIGLPVLKLKSDYLAIATLGFAEIIRAAVVYEGFGPLTNGSNLLYGFTSFPASPSRWAASPCIWKRSCPSSSRVPASRSSCCSSTPPMAVRSRPSATMRSPQRQWASTSPATSG